MSGVGVSTDRNCDYDVSQFGVNKNSSDNEAEVKQEDHVTKLMDYPCQR